MITKIEKIENLGIYKNFTSSKINEFKKYNLIYGWNGSGKSTLSRLFSSFSGKDISELYSGFKTSVCVDGKVYTERQMPISSEFIKVFNEDFIKDNIDWNGILKSILLLDEENIDEMKLYNSLKKELYGDEDTRGMLKDSEDKEKELQDKERELQKILTNIGKNVKNNLQLLDTTDSYYMNYDKRKVLSLIEDGTNSISENDLIKEEELDAVIKKARPIKKEAITKSIYSLNLDNIQEEIRKTSDLLTKSVASRVIEELKNNFQLSSWVENGLNLHKTEHRKTCAFCGANITNERIKSLEAHFSNALSTLNSEIILAINNWEAYKINADVVLIDESDFYDELLEQVKEQNSEYRKISQSINHEIEVYIEALKEKQKKPFEKLEEEFEIDKIINASNRLNLVINKIKEYIDMHNEKSRNFDAVIRNAKKCIERHYIQEQIEQLQYNDKKLSIQQCKRDLDKIKEIFNKKKEEYITLENKLSSETLGAEEFNKKLEKFLGYGEIKIQFDENEKGYKIYRNGREEAKNLSEGEKTAIAFIYFITKIKENGRKIEDIILVIDDPISSFDSNKLFSSYAYMKSECDKAKQLFVLTHNYNFFSLVFGWFNKKHIKDTNKKQIPNYSIYRIENKFENGVRYAFLNDGGEGLKQATEYDYIFNMVYSLKDKLLSKQEMIFCGNVARKLVESFLSFKFPKQRADLMALLNAALPGNDNDIVREKIYKFINIYSHEKKIDVFTGLDTEVLDASSQTVINDILKMIKELDETHYNAMVEKVEKVVAD
ncbi:AAA family ATPase [Dialister invisus]|uniref:AAA family ATPase n=1 Tax=Dialister invisus TaxID=218538 RepID=UPI00307A4D87